MERIAISVRRLIHVAITHHGLTPQYVCAMAQKSRSEIHRPVKHHEDFAFTIDTALK